VKLHSSSGSLCGHNHSCAACRVVPLLFRALGWLLGKLSLFSHFAGSADRGACWIYRYTVLLLYSAYSTLTFAWVMETLATHTTDWQWQRQTVVLVLLLLCKCRKCPTPVQPHLQVSKSFSSKAAMVSALAYSAAQASLTLPVHWA